MPETSIIIRTYNEEKHLPALLRRIAEQEYRDFETIVVDSGSIDRTREIAAASADRLIPIRKHDFTFGYSLNEGIRNSSGQFIVIISAHAIPVDSSWLGNLIEPLRKQKTAMVYGRQHGVSQSKFGEFLDFNRTFGPKREVLKPPKFFANNANSAVRRDLWKQYPFDETLPGLEDIDWAKHWMKAGYIVVYEPSAGIYHVHDQTWAQVRHRYYREAQVISRLHLPREISREIRYFIGDLVQSVRQGVFPQKAGEIIRFRYEKTVGLVGGILDRSWMENPRLREQLLFDKPYRAVTIRAPREAVLQSLGIPELKPGEVLVRVAYEGVCATDLEIFEGHLGYYKSGMAKYPIVPGHEFSGVIVATGARVTEFAEHDPIVVECIQGCGECDACHNGNAIGCGSRTEVGVIGRNGGYAEYMITPARFVHRLPPSLTLKQAILCEPLAVVLKGLRRLGPIGQSAVIGGGPIGHLAALAIAHHGSNVVVFDRNADRLSYLALRRGCVEQDLQRIASFDTILEPTGDGQALDTVLHHSKAGAAILLLGLPYAKRDFSFESVVSYDKTIVGSVGSTAADFEEALRMLPQLESSAFFECIFRLEEFHQAWNAARSGKHLKVVLEING
jgi:2-desacetyl-2-hydroxyethyl bacteriochlorophyllide A dehydrogenase